MPSDARLRASTDTIIAPCIECACRSRHLASEWTRAAVDASPRPSAASAASGRRLGVGTCRNSRVCMGSIILVCVVLIIFGCMVLQVNRGDAAAVVDSGLHRCAGPTGAGHPGGRQRAAGHGRAGNRDRRRSRRPHSALDAAWRGGGASRAGHGPARRRQGARPEQLQRREAIGLAARRSARPLLR